VLDNVYNTVKQWANLPPFDNFYEAFQSKVAETLLVRPKVLKSFAVSMDEISTHLRTLINLCFQTLFKG
jgi:hypothetical protein